MNGLTGFTIGALTAYAGALPLILPYRRRWLRATRAGEAVLDAAVKMQRLLRVTQPSKPPVAASETFEPLAVHAGDMDVVVFGEDRHAHHH